MSQSRDHMQVHRLHMILENYMNTESRVTEITPGYKNLADLDSGKVGFTIALCKDNSAFIRDIYRKMIPRVNKLGIRLVLLLTLDTNF